MKLEQTLEYLGLDELPKAATTTSQKKMACLVERVTGVRDYAIAKNGGIVADIGFVSSVKRIIEFYPEPTKKEKKEAELPPPAEELPNIDLSKVEIVNKVDEFPPKFDEFNAEELPKVFVLKNALSVDEYQKAAEEELAAHLDKHIPSIEEIQRATDLADLEEIIPPELPLTGIPTPSAREQMIAFLETQRNKRSTLDTRTDEQLSDMCRRFGKEF
jgi:hypothetical protein